MSSSEVQLARSDAKSVKQHKLPCGTKGATNCGSREGHTEWPIDMHTIMNIDSIS